MSPSPSPVLMVESVSMASRILSFTNLRLQGDSPSSSSTTLMVIPCRHCLMLRHGATTTPRTHHHPHHHPHPHPHPRRPGAMLSPDMSLESDVRIHPWMNTFSLPGKRTQLIIHVLNPLDSWPLHEI
ncbi:hypothetical protein EYF80_038425 [Liparis tanakae]|uniref:Uncharacterized protein n=1 Tax=Liparis tanakae TaxID=230148 RepID=A0A4Z2GCW2_9TELE|nr:hypothetical protein EYF80_038425 [Liparis tanakae]